MAHRTVQQVAALAGVTVRALHHYDEIGLLRPAARSDAGYRLYDEADLIRLHDIVLWRSLGFPLEEVQALLDDPSHDPLEALAHHRARLVDAVGQLHTRIQALDSTIEKLREGRPLVEPDLKALFDGFDPEAHAEEAERRWGDTEAWQEAKRRTARSGPREWAALKAEATAINHDLAELMRRGVPPHAATAKVAVEAHRAHIDRWFYPCTPEIHRGLADLYEADARFTASYDRVAPGLAAWIAAAIRALHTPPVRDL